MPYRIFRHVRANVIAYLALFVALGGSSYAAVRLTPGSVTSSALARHAVTRTKLANNSVTGANVVGKSLTSSDFKPGSVLRGLKGDMGASGDRGLQGLEGLRGDAGPAGPTGATGAAGRDGSASIGGRARLSGSAVSAAHGASTPVPLTGATWTQSAGELDFLAGSATVKIPATCTGSFGNALIVSVDGAAQTFALAPAAPASTTVTVPLVVGTLSEPDHDVSHTLSAALGNSCTKSGEDYSVVGVNIDAVKIG
jgi:Collagen triple helix repeat (20 copies)